MSAARARLGRSLPRPPRAGIVRRREVPGLPAPPGPFAWSVACGGLLFLSGLRGIDPATGRPARGDARRIARIFAHLDALLAANGSSPRRVLATRVYVTDMRRHRPLVNDAFLRFFGDDLPARTIVEVRALNQGDSIELEVVAARGPLRRPRRRAARDRAARRKRGGGAPAPLPEPTPSR